MKYELEYLSFRSILDQISLQSASEILFTLFLTTENHGFHKFDQNNMSSGRQ